MNVSTQEQALLDLIIADRERRCGELMAAAQRQAAELLREAHLHARKRVRTVLGDARERARQRVAAAQAQRQTRDTLAQQGPASDFLNQAMQLLPAQLAQRWREPSARRLWMQMAMQQAEQNLPAGAWRIEHAPGLQQEEMASLTGATHLAQAHSFQPNPQLLAGVRIHGNGNCIDASLAGLLSDRDSLSAALLQAWEVQR